MMTFSHPRRLVLRCLGLAAAAVLALSAAPSRRAEALSLISPATIPAAKNLSDGLPSEIRFGGGGHGGGGFHSGGGGGFHASGGGFHGGGAAFHGGGFHGRPAFYRGGGYGGYHHFHRHFYVGPAYYYGPSYYYPHRCRIVRTHYGPRRVCHVHHRYHWHHRHHHHWRVYW